MELNYNLLQLTAVLAKFEFASDFYLKELSIPQMVQEEANVKGKALYISC